MTFATEIDGAISAMDPRDLEITFTLFRPSQRTIDLVQQLGEAQLKDIAGDDFRGATVSVVDERAGIVVLVVKNTSPELPPSIKRAHKRFKRAGAQKASRQRRDLL